MPRKAIPAEAFNHGDPKRYRRGCRCRPCVRGVTAEVRVGRYLRTTGRGHTTTPDKAADRIERLRAAGMSDKQIQTAARITPDGFYRITRREGTIRRATENRILAITPPEEGAGSGTRVPAVGTVRRLRALAADGWTAAELGRRAGKHKQFIVYLQNQPSDNRVRMWVADYVAKLYKELERLQPESVIPPHIAARTRKLAAAKSWAPSAAWDDIDDPQATPDWTGHCGTDRGWWTHRLEQIPVCQPCDTAHEQWKQERAHLTSKERWTELARARAVAANREGNLAADARELLRLEIPIDVIAARLGVTRNHLQQAMLRHPAQQDMEAAA
ncbi:hypothetical protein ACGF3K_14350 [Streptomyces sp. NPDC047980]|uniref:hypothetical protein n=1 Tax=Streptomyces sp. NPDC047980 TaxID=3365494 RepID=UPI003721AC5D